MHQLMLLLVLVAGCKCIQFSWNEKINKWMQLHFMHAMIVIMWYLCAVLNHMCNSEMENHISYFFHFSSSFVRRCNIDGRRDTTRSVLRIAFIRNNNRFAAAAAATNENIRIKQLTQMHEKKRTMMWYWACRLIYSWNRLYRIVI